MSGLGCASEFIRETDGAPPPKCLSRNIRACAPSAIILHNGGQGLVLVLLLAPSNFGAK